MCPPTPGLGGRASLEFLPRSGLGLLVACPSRAWGRCGSWTGQTGRGLPAGAGGWCNRFYSKPPTLPDYKGLETWGGRPGLGIRSCFRKEHGSQVGDAVLTFARRRKAARPWADRHLSHTSAQSHLKSRRGHTWVLWPLLWPQGSATRIRVSRSPAQRDPSPHPYLLPRGHPSGTFAISLPPSGLQ